MKSGLVTITLSVYNLEDYVAEAIQSVLSQTYTEWELIAIDDASTDNTYQVLQSYESSKIKVFKNQINRGTYWNRNRAILLGQGEFITNLDGDDQYYPEKLARQVGEIGNHAICFCWYATKHKNGSIITEKTGYYCSNTMLFKRKLIDEIGYFDTVRYGADREYKKRILKHYSAIEIQEPLLYYHRKPNSLTTTESTSTRPNSIGRIYRNAYRENYTKWQNYESSPYLSFPQLKRSFPVGHISQEVPKETFTVSMASFPNRQESLKKSIDSIYPWVNHINVFLNEYETIPGFLNDTKITAQISAIDLGDRGKFYWIEETTGYHFFCDDDIEYSRTYFEYLANAIEKYDRKAIVAIHGSHLLDKNKSYYSTEGRKKYTFRQKRNTDLFVDFLGTGVMAYHTENIAIPFRIFEENNMADVFLGLYAKKVNIPLICCATFTQLIKDIKGNFEQSIYFHSCENKMTKFNKRASVDKILAQRW